MQHPVTLEVKSSEPKLVPLDEACRQIFDEAVKRSIKLTKQHYQWRDAQKIQALVSEREAELARGKSAEADKTRLEAHISSIGARAIKAERMFEDATVAYNSELNTRKALERTVASQQAMIDRLNYTLANLGARRSRSRSPKRNHNSWC